jgi:hypothetical protein
LNHKAWLAVLLFAPGLAAAAAAVSKLALVSTRPLVFGKFIAGTGGTVSIAANGGRTRGGNVVLLPSSPSSAGFLVTDKGNKNLALIVTLPSNTGVVLTSGANRMSVTGFSSDKGLTPILQNGSLALSIGATLNVGPNQPRGNYTGSIPVTVEYQ